MFRDKQYFAILHSLSVEPEEEIDEIVKLKTGRANKIKEIRKRVLGGKNINIHFMVS